MNNKVSFHITEYEDGTLKLECIDMRFHYREEEFYVDNIDKKDIFDLMRSISILTFQRYDKIAEFTISYLGE